MAWNGMVMGEGLRCHAIPPLYEQYTDEELNAAFDRVPDTDNHPLITAKILRRFLRELDK